MDLPSEIIERRRQSIFKVLKQTRKNIPRILYPAKVSFRNEDKIKTFSRERG